MGVPILAAFHTTGMHHSVSSGLSSRPAEAGLRLVLAAVTVPLALLPGLPAAASESAEIQEILDGREMYVDARQARLNQVARQPQSVSTRNSRGQLLFDSGAAGRLNRFSLLQLGAGCYRLQSGEILVSGRQNGCTRSARMSVRGTNYVLSVSEDGSSELSVLEGEVEVQPTIEEGGAVDPDEEPVVVAAGEKAALTPQGLLRELTDLLESDYRRILGGPLFRGYAVPLPGRLSLESYVRSRYPSLTFPSIPGAGRSIPTPRIPTGGFRLF
ncbi:iron dicitrate transport regulator FecR [Synechococcus sp. RSCCF101]|uniref:FecR domain-containing protein n=1 Tax=Synechococcus sp. RSCCF101 TaxID=2511069 RepID=UPI0012474503|nr:FecR domain-containing protein [Synechococcus sp. RSCCF101]QEY32782.1 iron dicitrate transport regulator FecR [Synechococcus sp. RSCCF101]